MLGSRRGLPGYCPRSLSQPCHPCHRRFMLVLQPFSSTFLFLPNERFQLKCRAFFLHAVRSARFFHMLRLAGVPAVEYPPEICFALLPLSHLHRAKWRSLNGGRSMAVGVTTLTIWARLLPFAGPGRESRCARSGRGGWLVGEARRRTLCLLLAQSRATLILILILLHSTEYTESGTRHGTCREYAGTGNRRVSRRASCSQPRRSGSGFISMR